MDDKQKTMAVGALVVVVVGIGAFQFLGGGLSGPHEKAKGSKTVVAKGSASKGGKEDAFVVRNPLVAGDLPVHDPFQEGKITSVLPEAPGSKAGPKSVRNPRGPRIPIFDPTGNGLNGRGGTSLQNGLPFPKPNEFSMSLAAVIMGDRPAAVFQDEQGNQRLVTLGGSVDGDSVVTRIARGTVTVAHKGKTVTLTVGAAKTNGNP